VAGVLVGGEGACRGARAMLTGLDPHPAPTPLNNSVSISGTRLPYHFQYQTICIYLISII